MTSITVENQQLIIRLEGINRVLALKSQLTIALKDILSVVFVSDLKTSDYLKWYTPKLGLFLPESVAEGSFYTKEGKLFVNIHQGHAGIVLRLKDETYQEIIIELENAEKIVSEINQLLVNE